MKRDSPNCVNSGLNFLGCPAPVTRLSRLTMAFVKNPLSPTEMTNALHRRNQHSNQPRSPLSDRSTSLCCLLLGSSRGTQIEVFSQRINLQHTASNSWMHKTYSRPLDLKTLRWHAEISTVTRTPVSDPHSERHLQKQQCEDHISFCVVGMYAPLACMSSTYIAKKGSSLAFPNAS